MGVVVAVVAVAALPIVGLLVAVVVVAAWSGRGTCTSTSTVGIGVHARRARVRGGRAVGRRRRIGVGGVAAVGPVRVGGRSAAVGRGRRSGGCCVL